MFKDEIITWISDYMAQNASPSAPIIIGLSGGKDSSICAALCVKAVGADRVIGVRIPDHTYGDAYARAGAVAEILGIKCLSFPIGDITDSMYETLMKFGYGNPNNFVFYNHPARIRMSILYMIANQLGGRVCNTSNASETYVGYDTKFGDQCGDFSPLGHLLVTDILSVGRSLDNLPNEFVEVPPDDGMCGQTDEDRWGFTYKQLDEYLLGIDVPDEVVEKIEKMHRAALHKIGVVKIPTFFPLKSLLI